MKGEPRDHLTRGMPHSARLQRRKKEAKQTPRGARWQRTRQGQRWRRADPPGPHRHRPYPSPSGEAHRNRIDGVRDAAAAAEKEEEEEAEEAERAAAADAPTPLPPPRRAPRPHPPPPPPPPPQRPPRPHPSATRPTRRASSEGHRSLGSLLLARPARSKGRLRRRRRRRQRKKKLPRGGPLLSGALRPLPSRSRAGVPLLRRSGHRRARAGWEPFGEDDGLLVSRQAGLRGLAQPDERGARRVRPRGTLDKARSGSRGRWETPRRRRRRGRRRGERPRGGSA